MYAYEMIHTCDMAKQNEPLKKSKHKMTENEL